MIYTHRDLGKVLHESVVSNFGDLRFADENLNFYLTDMLLRFVDARKISNPRDFRIESILLLETENIKKKLL